MPKFTTGSIAAAKSTAPKMAKERNRVYFLYGCRTIGAWLEQLEQLEQINAPSHARRSLSSPCRSFHSGISIFTNKKSPSEPRRSFDEPETDG